MNKNIYDHCSNAANFFGNISIKGLKNRRKHFKIGMGSKLIKSNTTNIKALANCLEDSYFYSKTGLLEQKNETLFIIEKEKNFYNKVERNNKKALLTASKMLPYIFFNDIAKRKALLYKGLKRIPLEKESEDE